jgi:uncharacterized membrane protein YphA (DoxX/SURF4 family)
MNRATRCFLVLLRLAIGWHFLIEGVVKVESVWTGRTETKQPFTSAIYLRESSGPLGNYFKNLAGNLDQETLGRAKLRPLQKGDDAERTPAINRFPPLLSDEWEEFYQRFVSHYQLDDAQRQKAREAFVRQKDETAKWLLSGVKDVNKPFPSGVAEVHQTTAERIADFEKKLAELEEMLKKELPSFAGAETIGKQKLATLKADVKRIRDDLTKDVNEQTAKMRTALQTTLGDDQKKLAALPDKEDRTSQPMWAWGYFKIYAVWTWERIDIVDWLTRWGLVVTGLCLILGLFTRPACLLGASLLLLFYVSMPPFPGLPENPKAEGHYLFVNKNLIELLALLVLSTTASGKWLGLDGLLQFLNPWRRSSQLQPNYDNGPSC